MTNQTLNAIANCLPKIKKITKHQFSACENIAVQAVDLKKLQKCMDNVAQPNLKASDFSNALAFVNLRTPYGILFTVKKKTIKSAPLNMTYLFAFDPKNIDRFRNTMRLTAMTGHLPRHEFDEIQTALSILRKAAVKTSSSRQVQAPRYVDLTDFVNRFKKEINNCIVKLNHETAKPAVKIKKIITVELPLLKDSDKDIYSKAIAKARRQIFGK